MHRNLTARSFFSGLFVARGIDKQVNQNLRKARGIHADRLGIGFDNPFDNYRIARTGKTCRTVNEACDLYNLFIKPHDAPFNTGNVKEVINELAEPQSLVHKLRRIRLALLSVPVHAVGDIGSQKP